MSLNRLTLTIDDYPVTTVEADGLIVSTAAGSTGCVEHLRAMTV